MKDTLQTSVLCLLTFVLGVIGCWAYQAGVVPDNSAVAPETTLVEDLTALHREHAVALDLAYQLGENEQALDAVKSRHREEIRKAYEKHLRTVPDWLR